VETGETEATAIVTTPSIRDQTTMARNHTAMVMVVQVTEEATTEAMEEADMAVVAVDMVEEVEVGIHINRIHTTLVLPTNPSHPLTPTGAREVMEDEVMVAMEEIQVTHKAMPLAIIPTILVLVADTMPLHLNKIVIVLTELVVVVAAAVMVDTVDMAPHPEEVHLIVAMSLVAEAEVGNWL